MYKVDEDHICLEVLRWPYLAASLEPVMMINGDVILHK